MIARPFGIKACEFKDMCVRPRRCSHAVRVDETEGAMAQEQHLTFGSFRLEVTSGRLWRGAQAIALRPRALAVLRYLLEHPGRLVTKAELRQHVWVGTHVTDTVLRVCIQEIRAALGDIAAAPQYVETVGAQGYRFLEGGDAGPPSPSTPVPMVGRQREAEWLDEWYQRAAQGTRQLAFVSGEAGVGKTTVVDLFLARLGAGSGVRVGHGQCVEHYGVGEPYLPWLEALGQLGHGPAGHEIIAELRRYAPLWLVQFPWLVSDAELERLQRQVQGATPARMLRELAEALEMLAAEQPLVLVLEDLHWSDPSTAEGLAYLAQRRPSARLLVLGTYRPVDVVLRAHPLRGVVQELRGRGQAVEMPLECLPAEDVAAYVAGRLGGPIEAALAGVVYERTDGNALFLVNIVEHLVQRGLVAWREGKWTLQVEAEATTSSLPEGLRQMLLRRIENLTPEVRQVLEAASVVGEEFETAAVAAGAGCPVAHVEACCEALAARHHFIDDAGQRVGENAARRSAYPEAIAALRKGLALLAAQPESLEGMRHELRLQLRLGELLSAVRGRMAPEVGKAYTRAYVLCQHMGETAWLFEVLWGLALFHCIDAQLHPASRYSQELFDLAQRQHNAVFLQRGHYALGICAFARGDFGTARAHLEEGIRMCDSAQPSLPIFHGVYDQGMRALCCLAQALWGLGHVEQARQRCQQALAVAQEGKYPPDLASAQVFAMILCQCCRDAAATHSHAEALMTLAEAQGFVLRREQARILWGWALAMQGRQEEGVAQICQAFTVYPIMEPGLYRPYLLGLWAEAYGQAGQPEAGLRAVNEALRLVETTEVRWWEAELHRVKGTLLLQLPTPDAHQAEACFRQALDIAHAQQAKALELRAAVSLSRLWQRQGQPEAARNLLAPIYGWFTEGFDTPDLQEARTLLGVQ
jgi:DNA-binding winged helix-turn-helix (wHTH) protein/predicted ATPase